MKRKTAILGGILFLGFVIVLAGCGQQAPTSGTGDYARASTDLKNVATGLQSTGGNISRSLGGSKIEDEGFDAFSLSSKKSGLSVQSIPAGWDSAKTISFESSYVWTTSTGIIITEEAEIYVRYLDASGNQLDPSNIFTWEGESFENAILLAKKQQTAVSFSSPYYTGYMNQLTDLPSSFSPPFTMRLTADGRITFLGAPVSTFEISSLNLTIAFAGTYAASGNMSWGYRAPESSYAYYYGTIVINTANLGVNPPAMTGDVYQDLTDDGVLNGVKIGTIAFGESGVKITLDNGAVIYAGVF